MSSARTSEISSASPSGDAGPDGDASSGEGIREAGRDYLGWLERRGLSTETIRARRSGLGFFLSFLKSRGVWRVCDLTRRIVEDYRAWVFHRPNAWTGNPLSEATRCADVAKVRYFCGWLYERKKALINPAGGIGPVRWRRRFPDVLTEDEVGRILAHADTGTAVGIRDRAMMEVLYSTGIRGGELADLNIYDVDRGEQMLRVRRGKGGKSRMAPLGKAACEWLTRYLEKSRPWLMNRAVSIAPGDVGLWRSRDGELLRKGHISWRVRNHIEAVKPGWGGGTHALRHAFATHMIQGGAHVRIVQEMLGHTNIHTTERYTHLKPLDLKEAHRKHHPRGKSREKTEAPVTVAQ